MEKRDYLDTVLEQIRYGKIRPSIEEELEHHIEDQKNDYMESGLDEKEALAKAIEEMGDPVETGTALDLVHRPKMEWKMILLVIGISVLGFLLQCGMHAEIGSELYPYNVSKMGIFMVIGAAVMILFCYLDYSRIGKAAKTGAAALLLLLLWSMIRGGTVNGQMGWLYPFGNTISMHQVMYLYIPLYGGILYSYRNQGRKGLLKSLVWMALPVFLVLRLPNVSLAAELFVIMALQICVCLKKEWFHASGKWVGAVIAMLVAFPVALIGGFLFFGAGYQQARILAWLGIGGEMSYQQSTLRSLLGGSSLLGKGTQTAAGMLPELGSDYIFAYVFSYYGILAALFLIILLAVFLIRIFRISLRQKNQMGNVMGAGCSLVFGIQIIMHILVNLSILPTASVSLPLFSYGVSGQLVSYALIGILLSIYRYQNVLPARPETGKGKVKTVRRKQFD